MNRELTAFVQIGLDTKIQDLRREISRLENLKHRMAQNGHPAPAAPVSRRITIRLPRRTIPQQEAERVRELLTTQPQSTSRLRDKIHAKHWDQSLGLVRAMPGVITEGVTSKMTLRLAEEVE